MWTWNPYSVTSAKTPIVAKKNRINKRTFYPSGEIYLIISKKVLEIYNNLLVVGLHADDSIRISHAYYFGLEESLKELFASNLNVERSCMASCTLYAIHHNAKVSVQTGLPTLRRSRTKCDRR